MEENQKAKKTGLWASIKHAYLHADQYPSYMKGWRAGAWLRIVVGTAILFALFWFVSDWLRVDLVVRQIFGTWILTTSATLIAYLSYAKYAAYLDYLNKGLDNAKSFAVLVRRSLMTLDYTAGILILSKSLGVHLWECLPRNALWELQESGEFIKLADDKTIMEFLVLTAAVEVARSEWSKVLNPETVLNGLSATQEEAVRELEAKTNTIRENLLTMIEKARTHFEVWRPDVMKPQQNFINALRKEGMFG